MEYMNCGQKWAVNLRIKYVGGANDKIIKLSEVCKTPENKLG
jgi:hypothetical protein